MKKNYTKFLNPMRLYFAPCLLILFSVNVIFANGVTGEKVLKNKITISLEDVPMKKALKSIEKKANVYFTYKSSLINQISDITIKAEKEVLAHVLDNLLVPFEIKYKLYGENSIVLIEADEEVEDDDRIVSGFVRDESGIPLIGANVSVKGSSIGTITDLDGSFSLNVPDNATELVVSYTGYDDIDVNIIGQSNIAVTMQEGVVLEGVTVLGSRGKPRTDVDRPVPIDVVSARELKATGQPDIAQALHFSAPSFSAVKFGINDLAPLVDPASLRGLSPDQTLLLVNGKRRHKVAFFSNNAGVGKGQLANDINSIPSAAIKRVEILRDGAAAQYGSDAIAGVMNFQLNDSREGGSVTLYTGVASTAPTWDGISNGGPEGERVYGEDRVRDGQTFSGSANFGLAWGEEGFLNTTLHFSHAEPTDRSGIYSHSSGWFTPEQVAAAGVSSDEELQRIRGIDPDRAILGTAENTNYGIFVNAGNKINDKFDFYGFGGLTRKQIVGGVFTRTPARTTRAVLEIFPNGYNPEVPSVLTDFQVLSGIKGDIGGGWTGDLSLGFSGNDVQLFARNTVNPSLDVDSPTQFYTGGLNVTQTVLNADIAKTFGNTTLAFGTEVRGESFQQSQGEIESFFPGPFRDSRDIGSSGREGFTDRTDGEFRRNNTGVYAEVESDLTDALLVNGAIRYEDYSDFGGDFSWKLAGRFKATDAVGIRASINRSFRAPGLAQYEYSNFSQISFDNDGNSVLEPILPVRNLLVQQAFGFDNLEPETSIDIAAGVTAKFEGLTLTIDGYRVAIDDRIVSLGGINPADFSAFNGTNFDEITVFTNAVNTVTTGLDFVASYRLFISEGNNLGLNLSANFNNTEVPEEDGVSLPPGLSALEGDLTTANNDIVYITDGSPKRKIIGSVDYSIGNVGFIVRGTNFGEVSEPRTRDDDGNPQILAAKTLFDISASYKFSENFSFTAGVNNIFDTYPDMLSRTQVRNEVIYSRRVNQFGTVGRWANISLNYNW